MTNKRILIVEDTAIVAHHLNHILTEMGIVEIDMTSTGEEALDLLKLKHYDLVLMDVMLEGPLNGIDTASEIKRNSQTPIIFITALSDSNSLAKIKKIGDGYFMKPFLAKEVENKIKDCMALAK